MFLEQVMFWIWDSGGWARAPTPNTYQNTTALMGVVQYYVPHGYTANPMRTNS